MEPPRQPDPDTAFEQYEFALKQCTETELLLMLHTIEARLGQPTESADDLVRVQAIAHRLNNLRTARQLHRRPKL